MTDTLEDLVASASDTGSRRARRNRRPAIALQLTAMLGLGTLLYPMGADWFSRLGHNAEVSGYVREVESIDQPTREQAIAAATAYNDQMPQGVLRDPYTNVNDPDDLAADAAYQAYLDVLRVSDSGVIGDLSYSRLGISLPIYHGTSDDVLSKGVGHLYGSSLPVGGPSTHSVMTSHSGLVNASLFTELPNAEIGDIFTVSVLGVTRYYQVRSLETVLPEQTGSLQIIDGEDWVTLITCTPIGVNSHRLLVQAERIDPPTGDEDRALSGDGVTAGFPWWLLYFVAGSAITAYLLFAPPRRRRAALADAEAPPPAASTEHDENQQKADQQ